MVLRVLGALLLAAQSFVHGQPANIAPRDVSPSDLSNYHSGLLISAGNQTSCEVALIDSSAGFVSASCLFFKANGELDDSIKYHVAITAAGGSGADVYSVTRVDAHPNYDLITYANDIAVLHWGDPKAITWRQNIALDRPSWSSIFYSRQTMASVSQSKWNSPVFHVTGGNSDAKGCDQADNVYNSNKDSFSCIVQSTTSIANGKCQTPYGAAWAVYQPNNVAIAALYGHTAIYKGREMCGSTGDQYHYFTLLQPYVAWAAEKIGRKINTYTSNSSFSYSGNPLFEMANNETAVPGVDTVYGDMYILAELYTGPPGTASNSGGGNNSSPPDDNTTQKSDSLSNDSYDSDSGAFEGSESSRGNGGEGGTPQMTSSNGLSRTETIAVATAVPIGAILILVMLFFAYKWWRKRHNVRNWDPTGESASMYRTGVMEELSGPATAPAPAPATAPNTHLGTPPSYSDHEFQNTSEPVGKA
ncbi:hypothetical protein H4R21_003649 [Coemansia helicoidea]|uniref:Uncharacterized protein n=1 Tax=Coemansia helicoidea TaxID=1286919 RepID=A0ACC1L2G5_9FUNG|nr:hypothetical protein H4R21_003649 [Coemansia helicoidea]